MWGAAASLWARPAPAAPGPAGQGPGFQRGERVTEATGDAGRPLALRPVQPWAAPVSTSRRNAGSRSPRAPAPTSSSSSPCPGPARDPLFSQTEAGWTCLPRGGGRASPATCWNSPQCPPHLSPWSQGARCWCASLPLLLKHLLSTCWMPGAGEAKADVRDASTRTMPRDTPGPNPRARGLGEGFCAEGPAWACPGEAAGPQRPDLTCPQARWCVKSPTAGCTTSWGAWSGRAGSTPWTAATCCCAAARSATRTRATGWSSTRVGPPGARGGGLRGAGACPAAGGGLSRCKPLRFRHQDHEELRQGPPEENQDRSSDEPAGGAGEGLAWRPRREGSPRSPRPPPGLSVPACGWRGRLLGRIPEDSRLAVTSPPSTVNSDAAGSQAPEGAGAGGRGQGQGQGQRQGVSRRPPLTGS